MKPASWLSGGIKQSLRAGSGQLSISRTGRQSLLKTTSKTFSTSSRTASIAAPEISFPTEKIGDPIPEESPAGDGSGRWKHVRILPESRSYFTTQPAFTDGLLRLRFLLNKYAALPTVPATQAPRAVWQTLTEFKGKIGEPVKASRYQRVIVMLQRLNRISPSVVPAEVKNILKLYKRTIDPNLNKPNPIAIDRYGRALAVGRRKTSTARAWVVEGNGQVLVNGKPLTEVFGAHHDRESAVWALTSTQRIDKYNVWALVEGGGTTGQAEALTLAIAKALLAHEPALKPALRRAGCVTRDPRKVERKKAGHVKARKMPTWVAR